MLRLLHAVALAMLASSSPGSTRHASQVVTRAATLLPVQSPRGGSPVLGAAPAGDSLVISVLTMGEGEQVWELFGHDAIWIHDQTTRTDSVYNWGVFDFRAPNFILHFLQGQMRYSMGVDPLDLVIDGYRRSGRPVWVQRLNLTTDEKKSVLDQIRWNERPENVHYWYNYFTNNCATRVRDILDRALGGALHTKFAAEPTGTTYRWQALRLMQSGLPIDVGVDIGLGRSTDREISAWEASFLPVQLMDHLRDVTLDGGSRRLVASESVVLPSTRPPEPTNAPRLWAILLPLGIVMAALIIWTTMLAEGGSRGARIWAAVLVAAWSLKEGLLGLALTFLWTLTNHIAAHDNENVFLFNPLWLVVMIALPVGIVRGRVGPVGRWAAFAAAALAVCAILFHASTLSQQSNWPLIGLTVPPALAIAWAATRLTRRAG